MYHPHWQTIIEWKRVKRLPIKMPIHPPVFTINLHIGVFYGKMLAITRREAIRMGKHRTFTTARSSNPVKKIWPLAIQKATNESNC